MKKFKGKYYELEKVHKDEDKLQKRGMQLKRRGRVMSGTINDYQLVENGSYYALYVR